MKAVHVIGAGMSGLSCALRLAEAGLTVSVYEAGPRAGGRCRSYHDEKLGCVIDNGNHLVLSGNHAVARLLTTTGADKTEVTVGEARFPFFDLDSGERWALQLSDGRIPWWVFRPSRRPPGTGLSDYLSVLKVMRAGPKATVASLIPKTHRLYRCFWEPFTLAVLNTAPDEAAACLLRPVFEETFARGGAECRPVLTRRGLSAALVEPTVHRLQALGGALRFGARARSIEVENGRAAALDVAGEEIALSENDAVVVAVSPDNAKALLPEVTAPDRYRPILNVHFKLPDSLVGRANEPFLGLLGGLSQWVFFRGNVASVTVSAASGSLDDPADAIAATTWREVTRALAAEGMPLPPYRIIKEKRATFAQTPAQIVKRPKQRSVYGNLWLAGDWTESELPATIEGSVRSGEKAARAVLDAGAKENVAVV